jgi:hypothetical protein
MLLPPMPVVENPDKLDSRRLDLMVGFGLHKGVFAGVGWRIPVDDAGTHFIVPRASLGYDLSSNCLTSTSEISWWAIGRTADLGGKLDIAWTMVATDDLNIASHRLSVDPGLILRYEKYLIGIGIGPKLHFFEDGTRSNLLVNVEVNVSRHFLNPFF